MTAQHRDAGVPDASLGLDDPPAIAGVGMTEFASADGRPLIDLLLAAAERALDDAECDASAVDSVHVGNMAAEAFNERSGLANALTEQVRKMRGSFTTFNVLFADRADYFSGKS